MQHGAALVQFRPVMASETLVEWNGASPRQEAEARLQLGAEAVSRTVCLEVPDMQPFRAYARWAWDRQQLAPCNEVPVAVMSVDSFRGGGAAAEAAARASLRSLINTGRPELYWMCTWAPRDGPAGLAATNIAEPDRR